MGFKPEAEAIASNMGRLCEYVSTFNPKRPQKLAGGLYKQRLGTKVGTKPVRSKVKKGETIAATEVSRGFRICKKDELK
jgi:hypothetical protein